MSHRILACAFTIALAVAPAACSRNGSSPAGEKRPDAKANERAAEVTNSTDNREGASAGAVRDDKNAAGTTGTLDRGADRAAAAATDAGLTIKVQAKFMSDEVVKARHINVDTDNGVVTLKGSVQSRAESDRAEQLARETDGVKRVVNTLTLDAHGQ